MVAPAREMNQTPISSERIVFLTREVSSKERDIGGERIMDVVHIGA